MTAGCEPNDTGPVIVFDGHCVLCNGWVRFLLRRPRAARYRFASMQGEVGRRLLHEHGLDPDDPASFLLVEDGVARTDSEAILRVLRGLGSAWPVLVVLLRGVPRALRDRLYRWVARNRYRWFGRHESCPLPDPAERHRFL